MFSSHYLWQILQLWICITDFTDFFFPRKKIYLENKDDLQGNFSTLCCDTFEILPNTDNTFHSQNWGVTHPQSLFVSSNQQLLTQKCCAEYLLSNKNRCSFSHVIAVIQKLPENTFFQLISSCAQTPTEMEQW